MTAKVIPQGKQQYFASGTSIPLSGGKLWTYAAGTSTPKQTWSDSTQVTPNANPIILDSRGEATIYWNGNYKVVLMDSADTLIWSVDNVSSELMIGEVTTAMIADEAVTSAKILSLVASKVTYTPAGTGAVATDVQTELRRSVKLENFSTVQAAFDHCIDNDLDLEVCTLVTLTASINIDRLVDDAAYDHWFTIFSNTGGGFLVASDVVMFTTTLVNGSDPALPVSQMVRFRGLKFEADVNTRVAYVLDSNKFLRVEFEGCGFRKIKCLSAPSGYLTQSIHFTNCQARRWSGVLFSSKEATFDLRVVGGLYEAGGNGFDIDYPVGSYFNTTIEGMTTYAIKYIGGYGLTINGCYFEQNGDSDANGCSIDGSAGTGVDASESVTLIGNMFSGDTDTTTKPQVKWGEATSSVSIGNQCTTTLHDFVANSRVNVIGDYARVALSTDDTSSPHSDIPNEMHVGHLYRAEGYYDYGGAVYSTFVGGSGGFLHLRSFNGNVMSANGLDINEVGDVVTSGQLRQNPAASISPSVNGEFVVEKTSNTQLTFKLKGSDGVTRSYAMVVA